MALDDDLVGRLLGKYRIVRRIGRGGMGLVYQARDTRLERDAAIKVLPAEVADDEQVRERFLREARAAARLNHPHVVTVYEIDQQEGVWFIALELMAGSVLDLLQAKGALSWENATRAVAAVCRGLSAAHEAGLVHRDIKPGNLLRSAKGEIKLGDFGLAKAVAGEASLTTTGAVFGTPDFMSPEQIRGEPLDARSDLYSLGATYYTLLTGRPPFEAAQPIQVCFAHCANDVPDPSTQRPAIPAACGAIIRRAMAKERRDRYQSAAAMLADLKQTLDPDAEPSRVIRAASAVAAPSDSQAADKTAIESATRIMPPAAKPRRRTPPWLWPAAGLAAVIVGLAIFWLSSPYHRGAEAEWRPLFNGVDLSGWTVVPEHGQWFVKDGCLAAQGGDSFCFASNLQVDDFELKAECRINAAGNSGIFFRCDGDPWLPKGYEAHIDPLTVGRLNRNGLPGSSRASAAPAAVLPGEWFTVEISACGNRIQLKVNEQTTVDYREEEGGPRQGRLALQTFGPQTEVQFRNLRWRDLTP